MFYVLYIEVFNQVAPAQRPLPQASLQPPKADVEGGPRSSGGPVPLPEDIRRNQPSPRGGRGRGMPPMGGASGAMGRGGPPPGPPHTSFPRPGSSGGNKPAGPPATAAGPGQGLGVGSGAVPVGVGGGSGVPAAGSSSGGDAHQPPNRPDLQKLGLKFGGQISITSTGNQGKRGGQGGGGGGTDAQGVSITKLKGDLPVGSPVSIRDATNKHPQQGAPGTSSRPDQDAAGSIKVIKVRMIKVFGLSKPFPRFVMFVISRVLLQTV